MTGHDDLDRMLALVEELCDENTAEVRRFYDMERAGVPLGMQPTAWLSLRLEARRQNAAMHIALSRLRARINDEALDRDHEAWRLKMKEGLS